MAYKKNIICLANSRKPGGCCIAGKELVNGEYGQWIRPVSDRGAGEISEEEQKFSDGACPQLLDIISIILREPQLHKHKHQTENHLIDSSVLWKRIGEETWDKLEKIKDEPSGLWINHPRYEKNDRIPITEAEGLKNSLFLIYVQSMEVLVVNGSKARAKFTYNEDTYNLRITDPKAESYFFKREGLNENLISQRTLVERRIEARNDWEELKEAKKILMLDLKERIQEIKKQADLKYAQYKSGKYPNGYELKVEAVKLYEKAKKLEKEPDRLDKEIIIAKEKWDKLKEADSTTDPKAESYFFKRADRKYLLNNVYLCVSLSEPFNDYCYKLVAGVIGKDLPY